MSTKSDEAGWAREHQASYQVGPLLEMRGKEKVQVGFTIDLSARLPVERAPGAERREEAARIWERLKTIVESLAPPEGAKARLEIEPREIVAYFRPENEM